LGGWLDDWLRSRGSSLLLEIRRFSPIGRICSLKGLVTAMPKEATCAQLWICGAASPQGPSSMNDEVSTAALERTPLSVANPAAGSEDAKPMEAATATCRSWHFLIDGALSYGCLSIRDAPDAHFKFHAASVLCFCASKVLDSWQQQQQLGQRAQDLAENVTEGRLGGMGETVQQLEKDKSGVDSAGAGHDGDGGGGDDASFQLEIEAPKQQEDTSFVKGQHVQGQQPPPALQPALLRPDTLEILMGLMWANLDEPLAQTA
ncbi:hypothetical protein VaNZ11_012626, partial [Volvox africanus]